MIESAVFTNVEGFQLAMNDDIAPLRRFTMEVDIRSQDRDKAQQHGVWIGRTFFGKRTLHFEGDLFADDAGTYIQRRRAMLKALMPRTQRAERIAGTLVMRFTGMTEDVQCDCSLDGWPEIPMEGLSPAFTTYLINLKAFDPRFYGATLNSGQAYIDTNVVGRTYNKAFNKTYAASVSTGDIIVTNSGEIETYPVVTFYGPCTGPRIILIRPGYDNLTLSLDDLVLTSVTDYVTIDFNPSNRKITLPGGGDAYSFKSGDWWSLEPGNNSIRYSAFAAGVGTYARVQWRNAYML